MNLYNTVIDLWALDQIVPNEHLNTELLTQAKSTNPRQVCSLHAFFYHRNEPIQQAILALINQRMVFLENQIHVDNAQVERIHMRMPHANRVSATIRARMNANLYLLLHYGKHLSKHHTVGDPSYTDNLRRVMEMIPLRMSWKKYKTYVEFLRDNDALFRPNLRIRYFYSDQNKNLENLEYSEWIGTWYPDLFEAAIARLTTSHVSIRTQRSNNLKKVGDLKRICHSLIIEPDHKVAPVEIINVERENYSRLILQETIHYALLLSGHFLQLMPFDAFDQIAPSVKTNLLAPQYQPIHTHVNGDLSIMPISFMQQLSKRVLYMLRQCTLEEHIRLAGQIRMMGGLWVKHEGLAWNAYNTSPLWVPPTRPFENRLIFLNCYLTWLHQVRELTTAKNYWISVRSLPLMLELKSVIFDFLVDFDIPLLRSKAHYKLGKTVEYYTKYREENPTFQKNFSEWLAPQRDLASHNRFTLFAGRPYSRAGEQELWVEKNTPSL